MRVHAVAGRRLPGVGVGQQVIRPDATAAPFTVAVNVYVPAATGGVENTPVSPGFSWAELDWSWVGPPDHEPTTVAAPVPET